ncbi:uncharacterized protein LOC123297729 [Chrysoperla carnea]|uniref:uncharacterized protein LOC123297729 n=1 Tax=Chrysoperla carnea TaxID=189513 RepID=UPI001D065A9D|nr:uncharacterized protein LOC123297729 [Chrysoperla carnea]
MAEPKKALYSTCVACLGFLCLVLSATAVGLPMWGYFDTLHGGVGGEKGYFGPWKTCKQLLSRERCGPYDSRFRTSAVVYMAGWAALTSTILLAIFCLLSVIQIAMINSKDKVVVSYSFAVMAKLALSLLATLLCIAAAVLFALQSDDPGSNGFQIRRGEGFYIQLLCIILDFFLFILALYDVIFTRRPGGDPTHTLPPPGVDAVTYGNPGYRERGGTNNNGAGISMTDASGKPYAHRATAAANGSLASVDTTMTTASSNGSTVGSSVTRSPLRSSLKKPRPKEGLGIQNPGFSGTSPTLSRNGSTKKVRIQTHSTEV